MIGSFSLDMIRKKHTRQTVVFLWKIESRHVLPVYDLSMYWLYCSVTLKRPFYIRYNEPACYVIFKRGGTEKCESEREPFTFSLTSDPGTCFSKAPITNGPVKLFLFTFNIEV